LNLAPNETQPFQYEDDFNHLSVRIEENVTKLNDVLEECIDFIEEGQKRGNCFVHCSTAKPGLSRSTSVCIAYLINKEKKGYADAFNIVSSGFVQMIYYYTMYYLGCECSS
jgi:protein-tyrosine phosphatase